MFTTILRTIALFQIYQTASSTTTDATFNNYHILPPSSWDTHVHVFDPYNHPFSPSRTYTPLIATSYQLLAFNANLTSTRHPANIVLVQASVYGTDNSLNIELLRKHAACNSSKGKLRAITVFDEKNVTDEVLDMWDGLGVRGFRVNLESSGTSVNYTDVARTIVDTAARVKKYAHWKCQLYVSGLAWDYLNETIRDIPLQVIADHQGGMKGASLLPANMSVTEQPGYASLVSLAKAGKVWIKISALYRASNMTSGYGDVEPLIKALAKEVPQQLIWASDWPHTSGLNRTEANRYVPENFRVVDDGAIIENIKKWVGEKLWWRMTVETPAKVYQ